MTELKPYPKYKDSGVEWIGEIPERWDKVKLSWLFNEIGSGTTPISNNEKYYNDGNIHWINTGDLNDDYLTNTKNKITELALKDYTTLKLYPENSLVVAMYGATIGKISLTKIKAATNQACCVLTKPINTRIKFIFYWFLTNREDIINSASGGGQSNISQSLIRSLNVFLPTLEEQDFIIHFLDTKIPQINLLISEKERLIALLEEKRQAVITETVTKGLDPNVKMKDSGIEWIGEIPEHWNLVKLKFIGKPTMGLLYSPNDLSTSDDGLLVLRASNIQSGKIILDREDNIYVNKDIPPELISQIGDILICARSGSRELIGKSALIDANSAGKSFGAFTTIFRSEYNNFLNYVFQSGLFSSQIGTYLTSTINQLTMSNLKNLEIVLPPDSEQNKIVNFLNNYTKKVDELMSEIKIQISKLKEYRESLIFEAVTGKIDLRNIEPSDFDREEEKEWESTIQS